MILNTMANLTRIFLTVLACCASNDELPDNFSDRSIGVVIREDEILIEYRVGLSLRELKRFCTEWNVSLSDDSPSELMSQFAANLGNRLDQMIEIKINGNPVKPELVSSRGGGQHHVSAMILLRIPLAKETRDFEFNLADRSFFELNGELRLGCKGLGNAMLRQTNVAPLVVRASRIDLSGMERVAREKASTIAAHVIVSDAPPKK